MIASQKTLWIRLLESLRFRVAICVAVSVVVPAWKSPRSHAQEPIVATARFVVLDGKLDEPDAKRDQRAGSPIPGCFIFVPPSDSAVFNKYPEMRRWLDANRGGRVPQHHQFKLAGRTISPAAAVLRVGDSVSRYLNPEGHLALAMFSNPPIGPSPSVMPHYTFTKTELLPIKISAVAPTAAESHALILDHGFGAASDENGKLVIRGLPKGIDIPMRVSVPNAKQPVTFESHAHDIENNGRFVIRLEGNGKPIRILAAMNQVQKTAERAETPADLLPPCVRVSGTAQDSSRLLLSPTKMSLGCGPCSETCEITPRQVFELLRKHPTVRELQLWGWPVATSKCHELLRGLNSIPHVQRVSLLGLEIDTRTLSIVADNPHVRELALGGRCRFSGSRENDFAPLFDAIAKSAHLERLEISRHTKISCRELSRLKQMPRLRHLVFDGLIDKPCLEGVARLRHLISLELPNYDPARHGVDCLSGLEHLEHLTCTWSNRQPSIALHRLPAITSLTILADPASVDWEALKSIPKLQALRVQGR